MTAKEAHYDRDGLQQLLDDQLSPGAAADVTRHIDSCETCRCTLETMAAGDAWWQDARRFLNDSSTVDVLPRNAADGNTIPILFQRTGYGARRTGARFSRAAR